jgi:hypothetical protein
MDAPPSQRPWISFTLSAALHAALLVLAVLLTRQREEPAPTQRGAEASDPGRQVQMVYLEPRPPQASATKPPPPEPEPQPKPKPPDPPPPAATPTPPRAVAPPPEKAQHDPEPDANAPPEATRAEGEERTTDDPAGSERTGTDAKSGSSTNTEVATMASEARRIFGRPRAGPRAGAGPRAIRPMEAYLPDHPERCIPREPSPRDTAGGTQFGVVVGKIFRKDDGQPLSGAHLQMLGTPYVTFTDQTGEYRFRFDMALVDNCRTQYVRVTAPGYESRLLVLMVGANVQSEDVRLKRR